MKTDFSLQSELSLFLSINKFSQTSKEL